MADLNSMLARTVADHGERPAIRLDGLVLSYAQLHDAAGRRVVQLRVGQYEAVQANGRTLAVIRYRSSKHGV